MMITSAGSTEMVSSTRLCVTKSYTRAKGPNVVFNPHAYRERSTRCLRESLH